MGVSCLCRVTASAWAITRQGLPIAHDGRQRLSATAALRMVRLSMPSVGSVCSLSLCLLALAALAAILPMAHAAGCDMSHLSSGATVAS